MNEGKEKMTAIEFMEKQLKKHLIDYEREIVRGVPEEVIHNIENKIGYYEAAIKSLKGKGNEGERE